MDDRYILWAIIVVSAVTILLRFIPFLIFNSNRPTPSIILWLGKVLPYAIMGMLVVYCLKDIAFSQYPYGLPELISCAAVIILHIWKRNSLISIAGGTICYMILIQIVFT